MSTSGKMRNVDIALRNAAVMLVFVGLSNYLHRRAEVAATEARARQGHTIDKRDRLWDTAK